MPQSVLIRASEASPELNSRSGSGSAPQRPPPPLSPGGALCNGTPLTDATEAELLGLLHLTRASPLAPVGVHRADPHRLQPDVLSLQIMT